MRICFLVEELYRNDGIPRDVVRQLADWGHRVDVLRPSGSLLALDGLVRAGSHDVWVLKTVSGGPGLGLLEAASAAGLTTVNDARAIRVVRDKVSAAIRAAGQGLPVPPTWAAARPSDLAGIPGDYYPLVVKPAEGSRGRAVRRVDSIDQLASLEAEFAGEGMLIAQPWVRNSGIDLKVYSADGELFATERTSPLVAGERTERAVPLGREVADIVHRIGELYGLDLFGVDVVFGPDGPVVVDVNDFPSFRQVPDAVPRVARAVLNLARRGSSVPAPRSVVPVAGAVW
ncbi:ATP-grasp domain-containing protein [Kitasatospora sp. NPDC001664]|uniref:ATP-grasp domain-containing protein n=1 Tax=Kitasatospora albolonga TaxID=68173 RepID=UPI0031EFBC83